MNDPSNAVERRFTEMIMALTPAQRLAMASRMFDTGRKLALAGLQMASGPMKPSELSAKLFLRMYGGDFSSAEAARILKSIPKMQLGSES